MPAQPYVRMVGPGVDPANVGRKTPHGATLKIVATNICGSDQHMVRGRTTAPAGLILGHEITAEVIEAGPGVEFIKEGDLVSVPFNIACGRCRMCKEGNTGVCLNVNPPEGGAAPSSGGGHAAQASASAAVCSAMIALRSATSQRTAWNFGSGPIEQPWPIANA